MTPRMIQASEDLAKAVITGRHYISLWNNEHYTYVPRFLVFEFVWYSSLFGRFNYERSRLTWSTISECLFGRTK